MGSSTSSKTTFVVKERTPELLPRVTKFNKLYNLENKIGDGSFAQVVECRRRSDKKLFAAKIINKNVLSEKELIGLKNEISILKHINHKNVITLIDVFDDGKSVTIVLELCDGKDLFDKIVEATKKGRTGFTESYSAKITYIIANTLQHLNENGVVHRDIKPENILFGIDGTLKVTDFGLAHSIIPSTSSIDSILMDDTFGTPFYVAPEIVKKEWYNYKCDMWSLGVILYIMLVGYHPFRAKTLHLIYKLIINGEYNFDSRRWKKISKEAKHLISCLLEVDPKKRYSPNDVKQHQWIIKHLT